MLWVSWLEWVWKLRSAFSRERTFFWGVFVLISFSIRQDLSGVTSFVRCSGMRPKFYQRILHHFHSDGVDLAKLTQLWVQICLQILQHCLEMVNGRIIILGDGLKAGKEGRKMPGVKLLHQQSQNNSKPEYIMGHSIQAISLLVKGGESHIAVPLAGRIHEGFKTSNRYKKTLIDKILELLAGLRIGSNFYLVADAYYASKKMIRNLIKDGNHLLTRVKTNAVAYFPHPPTKKKRKVGRPKKFGEKLRLVTIFQQENNFRTIESPVYGEKGVKIKVHEMDLLMKGVGLLVKYVFVIHPHRGKIILLTTDLELSSSTVIRLYGLRFKIEVGFKHAVHTLGTFTYRFWMKGMKKIRRRDGDQFLHKMPLTYRDKFFKKIQAYQFHIQMGLIAQGLMQCLAILKTKWVWKNFGGWVRTIRPGIVPTERIVGNALRNGFLEFSSGPMVEEKFGKFLSERIDFEESSIYGLTG